MFYVFSVSGFKAFNAMAAVICLVHYSPVQFIPVSPVLLQYSTVIAFVQDRPSQDAYNLCKEMELHHNSWAWRQKRDIVFVFWVIFWLNKCIGRSIYQYVPTDAPWIMVYLMLVKLYVTNSTVWFSRVMTLREHDGRVVKVVLQKRLEGHIISGRYYWY